MQVHICPSFTRLVVAASAAISVHASWVASWVGTGTVWKWSKTQIESKGPSSAALATPSMVAQCSFGSIPARSKRHPCGTNSPNRMLITLGRLAGCGRGRGPGSRLVLAGLRPFRMGEDMITKDLWPYTTIFLRHDKTLRDHGGGGDRGRAG